ncbi:MAG TPA: hypothetical protein VGC41_19185, partial [Kofleriaceae bacterium]
MIAALLALATTASAAPKLVVLDVDHLDTTFSFTSNALQPETRDPGGLLVPPGIASEWLRLGLQPGDIVQTVNGSHVGDHFYISE